jgi:hypothetical protein
VRCSTAAQAAAVWRYSAQVQGAVNTVRKVWFVVEVRYVEPTYSSRHGGAQEPYRFRYRIEATTREAAVRMALDEFGRNETSQRS